MADIEAELDYSVDAGTPFANIENVSVVAAMRVATLEEGILELERGLPTIVDLGINDATVLGYGGNVPFLHAVVLVGVEPEAVLFFDPLSQVQLSTCEPTSCDRRAFGHLWRSGWVLSPVPHR